MEIRTVLLKDHCSLRVGGKGLLVEVRNDEELRDAVMYAKQRSLRVHLLGEGTNTFFADHMPDTLVIKMCMKGIEKDEREDGVYVTAQAGEIWDDLVSFAVKEKLWGIENLSLIPGTVGAAPVQNIGAYGVELQDIFVSLRALALDTMEWKEFDVSACQFDYRNSFFRREEHPYVIVSITLRLSRARKPVLSYKPLDLLNADSVPIEIIRDEVIRIRTNKLPDYKKYPNAGSFFKNPIVESVILEKTYPGLPYIPHKHGYKIPCAWLIEHVAHMKGVRRGEVGTWPDQPLVIINYGEASAQDIKDFSSHIVSLIHEKTGLTLEREVNFLS